MAVERKNKVRYVIKLGTRVLTMKDGALAETRIKDFIQTVAQFKDKNTEFVLVSSGAVGLGRKELGISKPLELAEKQACAAIGQVSLMGTYKRIASEEGLQVAQILLTNGDFADRNKYLNLRGSLEKLLQLEVVPILNENDPVSVEEIRELSKDRSFGDNDRLSALIAAKLEADWLFILTDVDGVFTENPKENAAAQVVRDIPDVRKFAVNTKGKSEMGRGGMASKLEAAKIAAMAGVPTVIASGLKTNILSDLLKDASSHGTKIKAYKKISSRSRWIGLSSGYAGIVVINNGAQEALEKKGASLLPAGVIDVVGEFKKGEVIKVQNEKGEEVARGISEVDSVLGRKILGKKRAEPKNFIHRDNMVIFVSESSYE